MYEKLNFKDRIVEKPNTYTVQTNDDGTVTLIPAFGKTLQEGTAINHGSMDHIEEGILELNKSFNNFKTTVYVKDNFAVLEGTITMPEKNDSNLLGNVTFNYPTGFTKDNSALISLMGSRIRDTASSYSTYYPADTSMAQVLGVGNMYCKLQESGITVTISKSDLIQNSYSSKIRIVLLKYKD